MAQPSAATARSQAVQAYRKANVKLSAQSKAPKVRFGNKQKVSGAVAQRSGARLAALGGTVKGVDGTDGYTGAEARKILEARKNQKASKGKIKTPPRPRMTTQRPSRIGDHG